MKEQKGLKNNCFSINSRPNARRAPAAPTNMKAAGTRSINATVAIALLAYAFLYYVDVFCVIVPWLSYSVPGVANICIITLTTLTSFYCYLFCVLRDPGQVPAAWTPDTEAESSVQEVKRKGGAPRYCQKCQQYKPPRSHHCRVCQRCVLRMDHHCPYTNNCVGHSNYRAFLVFLIYVNAALIHTLGLIAAHTVHILQTSYEQRILRTGPQAKPVILDSGIRNIWLWALLQTLAFALALPLSVGLLLLLGWHVHLVLQNKTTIEYQEGVTACVQGLPADEHPYDLGTYHNLHQILGEGVGTWLLPPTVPTEGGTSFVSIWTMEKHGLL